MLLLCGQLRRLRSLHLSGCKRLTARLLGQMLAATGRADDNKGDDCVVDGKRAEDKGALRVGGNVPIQVAVMALPPPPSGLRTLNLQRCFQLNGACLGSILGACAAGAAEAAKLSCLAMSHVDLGLQLLQQRQQITAAVPSSRGCSSSSSMSSLRFLALNNCTLLDASGLSSLSSACPRLVFLSLGGSTFDLRRLQEDAHHHAHAARPGELEANPPSGCTAATESCTVAWKRSVRAAVDTCPALHDSGLSAATLELLAGMAAALAVAALSLPDLSALELSFMPPAAVAAVSHALNAVMYDQGGSCQQTPPAEVWDLTCASGVRLALAALERARRGPPEGPPAVQPSLRPSSLQLGVGEDEGRPSSSSLALVLRCAVSCSSSARATPLHAAAGRDARIPLRACPILHLAHSAADSTSAVGEDTRGIELVDGLLALGAALDARDVGGATALFLASEAGRTAVVRRLLDAGADPSISNVAGESPLYIASLKGHLEVVRALVHAFLARGGEPWHRLRYADGWTPLMAAAVADHYEVACFQLGALGGGGGEGDGYDGGEEEDEARLELVCAANRYGQSALHIAARKGSLRMLRLLLGAGGFYALGAADCAGETPMDVAVKHAHMDAVAEFTRACAFA